MYFRDDWQVFDDASQAAATELLLYFRSLREEIGIEIFLRAW